MIGQAVRDKGGSTAIDIIVTAGAKINGIAGFDRWRGRFVVKIKAKPVEGKANKAVIRLFSQLLEIPQGSIRIAAGDKSTQKTILVALEVDEVKHRLESVAK